MQYFMMTFVWICQRDFFEKKLAFSAQMRYNNQALLKIR